jgi:hypothetical protein
MGNFREVSNYDELYPGRFLKAGLFKGKKPTLTIKNVGIEDMEDNAGKSKVKAIISFVERPMELVMCKTNGICIKAMFGKETANWIGKRVTLFAGNWNGEECVRVWGSPDIQQEIKVEVELPRRKPFPMVMHKMAAEGPAAVSAGSNTDPRIAAGWEILGWSKAEGETNRSQSTYLDDAQYLGHINALIDKMNAA